MVETGKGDHLHLLPARYIKRILWTHQVRLNNIIMDAITTPTPVLHSVLLPSSLDVVDN